MKSGSQSKGNLKTIFGQKYHQSDVLYYFQVLIGKIITDYHLALMSNQILLHLSA